MTDQQKTYEEASTLADLVREATDSIVFTDLKGNIRYVNPSFERITGYSFKEVKGKNPKILRSPNSQHSPDFYVEMWQKLVKGDVWHGEFLNKKKNGEDYVEEVSIFPVKDRKTGNVIGYGAVKKDITHQRQLEDQLKKSFDELVILKEKAESANRLKSMFLANMSHDIRTPLNAIMGFTDLLLKTERRENSKNFLSKIKDSSHILLSLIDDILDFSKIEAGQLDISNQAFSVRDIMNSLQSLFEIQFNQKQLHFESTVDNTVPLKVCNDKWRLRQVLSNLLSNALKFTSEGEVTTRVSYDKEKDVLLIKVSDTGIGIPPEHLDHIFDPFYQVQHPVKVDRKGTGLGLAICKKLTHLMGGRLRVHSTPGTGTLFDIELPANTPCVQKEKTREKKEALGSLQAHPEIDLKNKTGNTILIAEDNPVNRELITEQFNEAGFLSLLLAENGKSAVEMALKQKPDLILMDIQMPVMDGNQAVARLKEKGYKGPIIILSAYAMMEDIEKSLKAGASGYITKPIDFETFFQRIAPFLKEKSGSSSRKNLKHYNPRLASHISLTVRGPASLRIKNIFLNDVEKKLDVIDKILEQNSFESEIETIKSIAHSYRGNAGYFELKPLESVAGQLESAIKNKKSVQEQLKLTHTLAGILEKILLENKKE